MNKGRVRSQGSLRSAKSSSHTVTNKEEIFIPPLDVLTVKILSLRLTNEDFRRYAIKVTFFDQLLISTTIMPIGARDRIEEKTIAIGTMNYDPSDYEKMCLFADSPLVGKTVSGRIFEDLKYQNVTFSQVSWRIKGNSPAEANILKFYL